MPLNKTPNRFPSPSVPFIRLSSLNSLTSSTQTLEARRMEDSTRMVGVAGELRLPASASSPTHRVPLSAPGSDDILPNGDHTATTVIPAVTMTAIGHD